MEDLFISFIFILIYGFPLPTCSLGWANIGDEELLVMANAIRMKQTLQEIW